MEVHRLARLLHLLRYTRCECRAKMEGRRRAWLRRRAWVQRVRLLRLLRRRVVEGTDPVRVLRDGRDRRVAVHRRARVGQPVVLGVGHRVEVLLLRDNLREVVVPWVAAPRRHRSVAEVRRVVGHGRGVEGVVGVQGLRLGEVLWRRRLRRRVPHRDGLGLLVVLVVDLGVNALMLLEVLGPLERLGAHLSVANTGQAKLAQSQTGHSRCTNGA